MDRLKFSRAKHNAKLKHLNLGLGYTFSLLSGWSCPFAKECLSKVVETPVGLRIKDGPHTKFRCFSASQEVLFPTLYKQRKHNLELLKHKTRPEMVKLIIESLPNKFDFIRIHVGGDFFNQDYLLAWVDVASLNPTKIFYAYTKSLPYWIRAKSYIDKVPNFVLTASYGGTQDKLISTGNLRYSKVVFSIEESEQLGLEIDHDDHLAVSKDVPKFALLIHGQMPKGSEAIKAVQKLRKKGIFGYGKKSVSA